MTDSRLAEIEERLKADISAPPWKADTGDGVVWSAEDSWVVSDALDSDATLIAHAPTDLADLVAEVRRLREAPFSWDYDADSDVLYISWSSVPTSHGVEMAPNIVLRLDEQNHVRGVTIYDLKRLRAATSPEE